MNFSCNKCQRRYSIADDKVRGKTVKVRCKNCQNVISVEGPPAEMEESTRVVSLADVERLREQDRTLAAEEEAAQQAQAQAVSATSWEDEPTRAMPVGDAAAPWFVMVKGKQEGPLEDGALRELVAQGTVTARSYFWQQGMADWKRGQDLPALEGLFLPEDPPPPAEPIPPPEPAMARSSTSWQPEPPPDSQTSWRTEPEPEPAPEPEPEPEPAPAPSPRVKHSTPWEPEADDTGPMAVADAQAAAAPLGELFSDLDLPASEQPRGGGYVARGGFDGLDDEHTPVNQVAEEPPSEPVKKARTGKSGGRGVGAKVVLVLLLLVLLPVGAVIALTELQVVPLRVYDTDAEGNPVPRTVSVFTPEGLEELRNVLTGNPSQPPAPRPAAAEPQAEAPAAEAPETPAAETPAAESPSTEPSTGDEVAPAPTEPDGTAQAPGEAPMDAGTALAGSDTSAVAPAAGGTDDIEVAPLQPATPAPAPASGPPKEEIDRVVERSRASFKTCIAQALRKNPRLRNGKLLLTTTVTHSGEVTKVAMDRPDIGGSPSGECFIERAQRIVFPPFSGEDVEVEIRLVLSRSG
ncbi:GYF domain-containing protein [Cystobacter fuscus]|uniref:GYF domain-containing protein n=1 Tax=Cystobacter fuscus TaxID=43 RepID=UPI002B2C7A3C|nr:AgmX/PglI C-terminal domain-containing protein [Cystobacter fuscus]